MQGVRGLELTQGEFLTLEPAGAHLVTAGATGTPVVLNGERRKLIFVLDFTGKATDANDTCDVYVDALVGSKWINAIHFTQVVGNGAAASSEFAVLDATNPGAVVVSATADAASGAVRPGVFGSQFRARWVVVDPTGSNASFNFSVTAYGT